MRWPSYWKDIVVKYHVIIEGWPHTEVPFRNLSDVSNLQKLEILLRGWQSGEIFFRRLSDAEFEMLDAARAAAVGWYTSRRHLEETFRDPAWRLAHYRIQTPSDQGRGRWLEAQGTERQVGVEEGD